MTKVKSKAPPKLSSGVYFDNAATSYPKPPSVCDAINYTLQHVGANPGRGENALTRSANKIIFEARETIAEFFNIPNSRNIVFTSNGTEALNLALKGFLKPGDHVITSGMEHNSVVRPLNSLKNDGVNVTIVQCDKQGKLNPDDVFKEIKENTRLIVITHASNVTGTILPVEEIGEIAKKKGIPLLVDAAQTAGTIPIDIVRNNISLLACPGHKSLLGPQGTGFLYISEELNLKPLIEGGTGSNSELSEQPDFLPDRFQSGTLNSPGIAGLKAGIEFINKKSIQTIKEHEDKLSKAFINKLKEINPVCIYGPLSMKEKTAVVSFNINGKDSAEIATALDEKYQIMVRVGLHCSPYAHKTIGTFPDGTIRASFSIFNTIEEVNYFIDSLKEIVN
jgi:cysteine desulfurase family protein